MAWPQDAYVGQKVVCIDDSLSRGNKVKYFKLHDTYTISRIESYGNQLGLFIDLIEVTGQCETGPNFRISRFRPVQTNEKGMEMLRELLNPVNHKVLVDDFDRVKAWTKSNEFLEDIFKWH